MVLLITKQYFFTLLTFVGVLENIQLVLSKPFISNQKEDCFENCVDKLFVISEKVYNSGNISSKCSPYYPFGNCVEKCYNHHDTIVSLQFLKKCDEIVHKYYGEVSKQKKCLQQNFGKVRERCNLKCAKEAINQMDMDGTTESYAVNGKRYVDSGSLCTSQICRLRCLDLSIEKHCPQTSKNIMKALLAPFSIFRGMMKQFPIHHTFRKSLFSSDCKELFDGGIIENKFYYSFDSSHKTGTSDGRMSDFVSDNKPTPPSPLQFVSHPSVSFSEMSVNDVSENGMNIVGGVEVNEEVDEDYEGFNVNGDRNIGNEESVNELLHNINNEYRKDQDIVYQAYYNFDKPVHTFNLKPSNHRFIADFSDECGDIMIIDGDQQIPHCSTPTLYFVTTEDDTINKIFMNEGMVEKYNSGQFSLEEIYEQYRNLLDRMRVNESQISSLFGNHFVRNLNDQNDNFPNGMLKGNVGDTPSLQNSDENSKMLGSVDAGGKEEGKIDYDQHFEQSIHAGNRKNLKDEFVVNTDNHNHNSGLIDDKLDDMNDNEEVNLLDDEIEDSQNSKDEDGVMFSNTKEEFTESNKLFSNRHTNLPFNPVSNNLSQQKLTQSDFTTPKHLSGTLNQESNFQIASENTKSRTKHPRTTNSAKNKEINARRDPTFHGQEEDFNDRFNNVLPDQERISYGLNGRLVARSPITFNVRLPILTKIHGRRTDNH